VGLRNVKSPHSTNLTRGIPGIAIQTAHTYDLPIASGQKQSFTRLIKPILTIDPFITQPCKEAKSFPFAFLNERCDLGQGQFCNLRDLNHCLRRITRGQRQRGKAVWA
jgi:hypothetical protein